MNTTDTYNHHHYAYDSDSDDGDDHKHNEPFHIEALDLDKMIRDHGEEASIGKRLSHLCQIDSYLKSQTEDSFSEPEFEEFYKKIGAEGWFTSVYNKSKNIVSGIISSVTSATKSLFYSLIDVIEFLKSQTQQFAVQLWTGIGEVIIESGKFTHHAIMSIPEPDAYIMGIVDLLESLKDFSVELSDAENTSQLVGGLVNKGLFMMIKSLWIGLLKIFGVISMDQSSNPDIIMSSDLLGLNSTPFTYGSISDLKTELEQDKKEQEMQKGYSEKQETPQNISNPLESSNVASTLTSEQRVRRILDGLSVSDTVEPIVFDSSFRSVKDTFPTFTRTPINDSPPKSGNVSDGNNGDEQYGGVGSTVLSWLRKALTAIVPIESYDTSWVEKLDFAVLSTFLGHILKFIEPILLKIVKTVGDALSRIIDAVSDIYSSISSPGSGFSQELSQYTLTPTIYFASVVSKITGYVNAKTENLSKWAIDGIQSICEEWMYSSHRLVKAARLLDLLEWGPFVDFHNLLLSYAKQGSTWKIIPKKDPSIDEDTEEMDVPGLFGIPTKTRVPKDKPQSPLSKETTATVDIYIPEDILEFFKFIYYLLSKYGVSYDGTTGIDDITSEEEEEEEQQQGDWNEEKGRNSNLRSNVVKQQERIILQIFEDQRVLYSIKKAEEGYGTEYKSLVSFADIEFWEQFLDVTNGDISLVSNYAENSYGDSQGLLEKLCSTTGWMTLILSVNESGDRLYHAGKCIYDPLAFGARIGYNVLSYVPSKVFGFTNNNVIKPAIRYATKKISSSFYAKKPGGIWSTIWKYLKWAWKIISSPVFLYTLSTMFPESRVGIIAGNFALSAGWTLISTLYRSGIKCIEVSLPYIQHMGEILSQQIVKENLDETVTVTNPMEYYEWTQTYESSKNMFSALLKENPDLPPDKVNKLNKLFEDYEQEVEKLSEEIDNRKTIGSLVPPPIESVRYFSKVVFQAETTKSFRKFPLYGDISSQEFQSVLRDGISSDISYELYEKVQVKRKSFCRYLDSIKRQISATKSKTEQQQQQQQQQEYKVPQDLFSIPSSYVEKGSVSGVASGNDPIPEIVGIKEQFIGVKGGGSSGRGKIFSPLREISNEARLQSKSVQNMKKDILEIVGAKDAIKSWADLKSKTETIFINLNDAKNRLYAVMSNNGSYSTESLTMSNLLTLKPYKHYLLPKEVEYERTVRLGAGEKVITYNDPVPNIANGGSFVNLTEYHHFLLQISKQSGAYDVIISTIANLKTNHEDMLQNMGVEATQQLLTAKEHVEAFNRNISSVYTLFSKDVKSDIPKETLETLEANFVKMIRETDQRTGEDVSDLLGIFRNIDKVLDHITILNEELIKSIYVRELNAVGYFDFLRLFMNLSLSLSTFVYFGGLVSRAAGNVVALNNIASTPFNKTTGKYDPIPESTLDEEERKYVIESLKKTSTAQLWPLFGPSFTRSRDTTHNWALLLKGYLKFDKKGEPYISETEKVSKQMTPFGISYKFDQIGANDKLLTEKDYVIQSSGIGVLQGKKTLHSIGYNTSNIVKILIVGSLTTRELSRLCTKGLDTQRQYDLLSEFTLSHTNPKSIMYDVLKELFSRPILNLIDISNEYDSSYINLEIGDDKSEYHKFTVEEIRTRGYYNKINLVMHDSNVCKKIIGRLQRVLKNALELTDKKTLRLGSIGFFQYVCNMVLMGGHEFSRQSRFEKLLSAILSTEMHVTYNLLTYKPQSIIDANSDTKVNGIWKVSLVHEKSQDNKNYNSIMSFINHKSRSYFRNIFTCIVAAIELLTNQFKLRMIETMVSDPDISRKISTALIRDMTRVYTNGTIGNYDKTNESAMVSFLPPVVKKAGNEYKQIGSESESGLGWSTVFESVSNITLSEINIFAANVKNYGDTIVEYYLTSLGRQLPSFGGQYLFRFASWSLSSLRLYDGHWTLPGDDVIPYFEKFILLSLIGGFFLWIPKLLASAGSKVNSKNERLWVRYTVYFTNLGLETDVTNKRLTDINVISRAIMKTTQLPLLTLGLCYTITKKLGIVGKIANYAASIAGKILVVYVGCRMLSKIFDEIGLTSFLSLGSTSWFGTKDESTDGKSKKEQEEEAHKSAEEKLKEKLKEKTQQGSSTGTDGGQQGSDTDAESEQQESDTVKDDKQQGTDSVNNEDTSYGYFSDLFGFSRDGTKFQSDDSTILSRMINLFKMQKKRSVVLHPITPNIKIYDDYSSILSDKVADKDKLAERFREFYRYVTGGNLSAEESAATRISRLLVGKVGVRYISEGFISGNGLSLDEFDNVKKALIEDDNVGGSTKTINNYLGGNIATGVALVPSFLKFVASSPDDVSFKKAMDNIPQDAPEVLANFFQTKITGPLIEIDKNPELRDKSSFMFNFSDLIRIDRFINTPGATELETDVFISSRYDTEGGNSFIGTSVNIVDVENPIELTPSSALLQVSSPEKESRKVLRKYQHSIGTVNAKLFNHSNSQHELLPSIETIYVDLPGLKVDEITGKVRLESVKNAKLIAKYMYAEFSSEKPHSRLVLFRLSSDRYTTMDYSRVDNMGKGVKMEEKFALFLPFDISISDDLINVPDEDLPKELFADTDTDKYISDISLRSLCRILCGDSIKDGLPEDDGESLKNTLDTFSLLREYHIEEASPHHHQTSVSTIGDLLKLAWLQFYSNPSKAKKYVNQVNNSHNRINNAGVSKLTVETPEYDIRERSFQFSPYAVIRRKKAIRNELTLNGFNVAEIDSVISKANVIDITTNTTRFRYS